MSEKTTLKAFKGCSTLAKGTKVEEGRERQAVEGEVVAKAVA